MVSITIVTWNSAHYLDECFAALERQDYRDLEVVIVDNASEDGTRAILRTVESKWRVIYNDCNVGFAAGQNQAIRLTCGEWVLCLNPDIVASPDFVTKLVAAGEAHPDAGAVCGKLLRWEPNGEQHRTNTIDSTGIYFTPNMRHLDRGAEEVDHGQYDRRNMCSAARVRRRSSDAISSRRFRLKANSSTRISSPFAKMPTWPGGRR
jgi:GT2 family glycosyltransferase